jgi:glutathione gamma-glutamylcysteinyltransferase
MEKRGTSYKAEEPSEGVNFKSEESKKLFQEALQNNTANPFFELSDQFTTQTYGSYCGPTNISIILNSMGIDPKKVVFFRNWRWYNEENIHGCDLKSVHDHGMPITDLKYILDCNRVETTLYRPICDNNINLPHNIEINSLFDKKKYEKLLLFEDFSKFKFTTIKEQYFIKAIEKGENIIFYNLINEDFFRISVLASTLYNNFYILCNIHRSQLGQEGGGHYLPVMAYHLKEDYVLIFDCARFKYNSRWHKLNILFNAQNGMDKVTNNTRGNIIIEKPINKKINIIKKDILMNINENHILEFINRIHFDNLIDKAKILNWLIINKFEYEEQLLLEENKELWKNIIPKIYLNNNKFKNIVDFLFMFNRLNFKIILLGCILYLNK